jgi:signal transduction histidine kinase
VTLETPSTRRRRDPVLSWFGAVWVASLLPYLAVFFGGEVPYDYRDGLAYSLLGTALAAGCLVDLRSVADPEGRRIRVLVALAFLAWAVEEPLETWVWSGEIDAFFALLELFFVSHYALLAAAALGEVRPGESVATRNLRRLAQLETALFAIGTFFYCIFLPARFDPEAAATYVPTAIFYVALDLLLVVLFVWRASRAEGGERGRWRLFALGYLLVAAGDGLYLVSLLVPFDLDPLVWLDPLWFLPYPALLAAARRRRPEPPAAPAAERAPEPAPGLLPFAPGFLYAVLVPALHLLFELSGRAARPPAAEFQRLFALLLALGLTALAAFHQSRIARAHAALEREIAEARRRLDAHQRLDAIGRLSAGVAHDFNNLLTVVLGRAELLLGRSAEPAARRDLETIVRAASRAAELTSELLAVGRRGMGVCERIDVGREVAACRAELSEICGERILVVTALAPDPLVVEIDPSHLARVLRNLASNARDAMPDGGRLTIASARRAVGVEELVRGEPLAPGEYAAIVFEDTGAGMDEETLARLFEPFFTTKGLGRGTGLGLATAYGLVRQYGGQIAVASRPGEGARFEVLLPLAPAAPVSR